jgi:hypothetical protein
MSFILRIILVAIIALVIELYFVKRFIGSVRKVFPGLSVKKIKRFTAAILLYANLYLIVGLFSLIYAQITQALIVFPFPFTWFDYLIQFPFWVFIVFVVQSILLFLLLEIIGLVLYSFFKQHREKSSIVLAKLRLAIVLIFLVYVPARIYYDHSTVSTRIVEFKKEGLPSSLDGYKIVLIADVQADRYTDEGRLNRYIKEVNNVNPDLVLIAGDVITSTPNFIELAADALGKIKSKYGVYSCVGDHDNWAYRGDTERSRREITEALLFRNIKMIDNDKIVVNVDNSKIGITFITNTYVERINKNKIDDLVSESPDEDLRIFLTHQPRSFLIDSAYRSGYDLFLAGHTHGGQLTFFFPFLNLSPTLIETKYVKGDFRFGDMLAVVNRGLGMSLAPIRYNSTPEVTLVILSGK